MSNWVHGLMFLTLIVIGPGFSFAKSPAPTLEGLTSLVFQYLDTADSDEANRLLQAILSRADGSIETVSRIMQTERVQRHCLFLNDKLIDLSKPLAVLTNGQVSFEGLVTLSLETLLQQARMRQDPHQLFPIHLTIMVQKQAS